MKEFSPRIFRIQRYSIHDGPGIRTTLFFQGCPLACRWCHNPESQALPELTEGRNTITAGIPYTGSDREAQAIPDLWIQDLVREIEKDRIYFEESGGGVTFSGGEPLSQGELVTTLARAYHGRGIHTCLDTSGHAPWEEMERAARAVDLILYDIKAVDPEIHTRLTGQPSARIVANLEALDRIQAPVVLRFPLIPGHTDAAENIGGIIEFLTSRTRFRKIHILPFHHTAQAKYAAMNQTDPMAGVEPPDAAAVEAAAHKFRSHGFTTIIGG